MTKEEAIQVMKEGKKVTHSYFESDEYIEMKQDLGIKYNPSIYVLSGKYEVTSIMFWYDRSGSQWNDGWEIYN